MNDDEFSPVEPGREIRPKIKPVTAGILGLIIVFFLYQIVGGLLAWAILGMDLKDADIVSFRLLTVASQILFILLPALILSKAVYEDVTFIIRVRKPGFYITILLILGFVPIQMILQSYMYIQNYLVIELAKIFPYINKMKVLLDQVDETNAQAYTSLISANNILDYFLVFIVVAVVPAVCEEFFFRGYVQKSFEFKYSPFVSAVLTSLFFSLYHVHPYQFIPLAILSFYLGTAAYFSNSILVPVIIHFLNNTVAIIMFFSGSSDINSSSSDVSFVDLKSAVMFFIVGILILSALFFYVKRFSKQNIS